MFKGNRSACVFQRERPGSPVVTGCNGFFFFFHRLISASHAFCISTDVERKEERERGRQGGMQERVRRGRV